MAAGCVSIGAHAGSQLLLDAGNPDNTPVPSTNYQFTGQFWLLDNTDPILQLFRAYIPLDFGSGAPPSRFIVQDPRGRLLFTDSVGTPTGDYIAPLLAATPYTPASRISKSEGDVDRFALGPNPTGSPYDYANALAAYRFTWSAVCPTGVNCSGNPVSFQVVLAALGPDSFLIDFNYSDFNTFSFPVTAGFSLGGTTVTYPGPFNATGPTYCFTGGRLGTYGGGTTCTIGVAVVPEPPMVALLFTGMAAIFGFAARRRARREPADCYASPSIPQSMS